MMKKKNELPALPPQAKRHIGMKAQNAISNTFIYILLIAITIIWLVPFVCIILQSFRVESTYMVGYIIPKQWGFDNYINLFSTDFPKWYVNTLITAVITSLLQTIIVLCMSYTLSRFRFSGRKLLMRFMLILGMFPGMLTMIILYRVLKDMGMTETNAVPGLILVYIASSGMGYYVSKGFFDTIPKSLDEAARIDGAGEFRIFWQILMPSIKPGWITLIVFAVQELWNMGASIFIYREELKTLAYALSQIAAAGIARAGVATAVSIVMMLVPVITFVITQSNILETMASSGMKD